MPKRCGLQLILNSRCARRSIQASPSAKKRGLPMTEAGARSPARHDSRTPALTSRSCRRLTSTRGMANRDRMPDAGRDGGRTDHVCTHRHDEGLKSPGSDAAGLHVAEDVTLPADKHNAVTCRVGSIPLQLGVWDLNFGAWRDMRATPRLIWPIVGYHCIGLAIPIMDLIGPVSVCLAAA